MLRFSGKNLFLVLLKKEVTRCVNTIKHKNNIDILKAPATKYEQYTHCFTADNNDYTVTVSVVKMYHVSFWGDLE